MSEKFTTLLGCAGIAAAIFAAPQAFAQEEEQAAEKPAADENKIDEELQAEIRYVEALVDSGFPDFAEPVIAATKKKWPEADTLFFAIEIRGMLSLGKFDEAEKKVASLPDRNGAKYWAARLEIANNFFARGKKTDCKAIYDAFFKKFSDPKKMPKELVEFYRNACYSWGQILVGDKRFDEATKVYEKLLTLINKEASDEDANTWCNVACETAEMYLHLATDIEKVPDRKKHLDPAKKLVDKLLWEQDKPVYFGRAIAMKANIELLRGDIAKAQATIDDYLDQLADLHKTIAEFDPEGKLGLLKQSPMPLCRYMLADMYWKEVQAEMKKPKRDDDRITALLFGDKLPNGKRNGAGAFNHALNVFARYPESTWAASAGELSETIREFTEKTYGKQIKTNITPEQMKRVRQMQFQGAHGKLAEGDYEGAIKDFLDALSRFPEVEESSPAVESLASAYLSMIVRSKDEAKKADWRIDADAIEGYISERFAGHANRTIMNAGGDATLRLAALEKQYGNISRADALYKAFLMNYRHHVNAAVTCASMAGEAQRAEKWDDAIAMYTIITKYYTNSVYYATALANLAVCQEKSGDRPAAIKTLTQYVAVEETPLKKMQSQMQLAMLYQKDGLDMITAADSAESEEAANKLIATGSAQIIRGIKQFQDFAKAAGEKLADAGVSAGEKKQYATLREGALYLAGDCWSRLKKPEAKLEMFRTKAVENFEEYVRAYPEGKYSKATYVKLGATYAALGNAEGSKSALDRLAAKFPDSDESKNAKPRLAKLLIDMGKRQEGTEIYAEMLKTDGAYTAGQFVNAGEALIEAKSWELADQAFDKAEAKAGTNQMSTVAKARIGKAKALFKQGPGSFVEARNQLDLFLQDDKMSKLAIAAEANLLLVEIASEQGRTEKNDALRKKHFAAAVGAVKKLRIYWKNKPQHEQDQI
ncbi:MAG: tetratricopeptide repeat protein, partial [Kiritimatiellae bacterium]|nr:tetratricopeptide repeat protein [Kiritimatiellia bacterium]